MIQFKVKIKDKYRYATQDHTEIMNHIKQGCIFTLVKADKDSIRLESFGLVKKPWFLLEEVERINQ